MSLAELISKRRSVPVATAIHAIPATHGPEFAGTVARIATVAVAKPTEPKDESYLWVLHFADREPLTVAFSPAATHVEVLASYPDALAAEPIEPGGR